MPGKDSLVTLLQSRKQLLIAESEINRVGMLEEGSLVVTEINGVVQHVKSFGSIASVTSILLAGVAALRSGKNDSAIAKPFWWQMAWKGAKVATSLWLAFQARPK